MDSLDAGAASPTYQCVVCQSTCLTPNELHRHQSYRHTSEELSLSIIGVHNAAIRTFDLPNGIVYDNSWLYDPNRHAQFYTYSANMLCDDNNNGDVVDYAFKAFTDRVVEEIGPAAVPDNEDCTLDLNRCIDEKNETANFAESQHFEQESWTGESKILDLSLKIDLEVETEIRMDTARDHFWGCGEGPSGEAENLGRNNKKSASSKTYVKSLHLEKLQTCVPDGFASKILDLGRKVFSETLTETTADVFGKRHIEDSENLGRDIDEKSKQPQIETCKKVQNLDEPQSCVQASEILDLSQKFYYEVHPEPTANSFGKRCKELGSDVGYFKGKAAKRRSSPSKCPVKIKTKKLIKPQQKLQSPKQAADKSANTENKESGNVDSAKQESQGSQDSLSWFESEASKIKRFNAKVKQIRASQKKPLDLTKVARKQLKGEGRGKTKKRTMQSCSREDAIWRCGSLDSEDLLGFDGEGATINATCSRNAKRPRVPRKKVTIYEASVEMSTEETHELPKKPLIEEITGGTEITRICTEHSSIVGSDQSVFTFRGKKSNLHVPTAGKAKKLRVSWKKDKISKTEVDNSAELPKEETAGETEIALNSAEHSSIIGSDQSLFELESNKSKIHVTTSGNAMKPRISKKKGKVTKTASDSSTEETADLLKKLLQEETSGETQIIQNQADGNGNRAECSSIVSSDKYSSHFERKKSKVFATTSGNATKPRVSKKRGNVSETEAGNSVDETAELLKKLFEEETAGEPQITQTRDNGNVNPQITQNWDNGNVNPQITQNWDNGNVNPQITQNQDNGNGNPQMTQNEDSGKGIRADSSSFFASAESTFHSESKEVKVDMASSVNAKTPITSVRRAKNHETAEDEPVKQESAGRITKPANQTCQQQIGPRPKWDCKSDDFPACLDADTPKINAKCTDNAAAQAEQTVADKPAKHESIAEVENGADQHCAEIGLQPNGDFESADFLACSNADGQKLNPMCAENDGAQAEKTVADKPAEQGSTGTTETDANQNCAKEARLQPNWDFETPDFLAYPDGDGQTIKAMRAGNVGAQTQNFGVGVTAELLKLQNRDDENGNCAERSSIFGSAESTIHFERKEPKIDVAASGSTKKQIDSKRKARNPKTVADKPTETETTKPANQNYAKEVRLRPNWDFEPADLLACSDGNSQKINATCAENAGVKAEKSAVEVTAKLLRDRLTEPYEEKAPPGTETLQNEDCENEDYSEHGSSFSSDEYLYYFPSEETKMAAMCSGYAKKPVASGKKSNNLNNVTVWPAKQKMTRKIVNNGNRNLSKQSSASSCDVFSYTGSEGEVATINPSTTFRKKSNDLKTVTVWSAKQRMTRKIFNIGNGNSSKRSSASSRDVFPYTGSEGVKATINPSVASKKKSNELKVVNVWPAKQKMTRKIVNDGISNLSKQSSGSSRDVFCYTGSESEEAPITPLSKFRAERLSELGKKSKKVNLEDENCAGHDSNLVHNIYTCTDHVTKKVKTSNVVGKKPKKMNAGNEKYAEHYSNFVPNIYTCTDRTNKRVEIKVPSAGKPKNRQVTSKKSTNSERVSDKPVFEKPARGTTKLYYQDFGSEIFVSQNSPPIIDVNSSTESGNEEEMPWNSPAGNCTKSIVVRNKKKNLKTAADERALRGTTPTADNSENREQDNVISIYKDSSPIPGGCSATDNELPPVTFIAYPPYVDENSILVLNPESRELVWKCLDTEDSQLDETASFHWRDGGSHQQFSETRKATTSRKVDSERSASFVPAVIGSSTSGEESSLRKTNVVRRSTRQRKVIQRYYS